jgi:RHS repeat-associated protein
MFMFTYNDAGRMSASIPSGSPTVYAYNALGHRVKKSGGAGTSYFVYDEAGHYLGQYNAAGALVEEIVWLGDIPVATLRTNTGGGIGFFYIHTDHLNTPVRLTRLEDNEIMWRWDRDPYGGGAPDEDADGNGAFVFFNMRFPGQFADVESGLHYNLRRDYDYRTGRYLESDPMGLDAGINPYAYVDGNPILFSDPSGLIKWTGTVGTLSYVNRYGATGMRFSVDSECKCGVQIHLEVNAIGASVGLGRRATGSIGPVTLNDPWPCPQDDALGGLFEVFSAGVSFGAIPIPPPGPASRIGPGKPGIALGVSKIFLGDSISEALPPGWSVGRDASIGATLGRAWITSATTKPCCEP